MGLRRWSLPWPFSLPSAALGPIHLSEVRCGGYERTLGDCPSLEGSQNGCQHDNDAAVRCNIPNLGFQDQVSLGLAWDTAWSQWGAVHERQRVLWAPEPAWSQPGMPSPLGVSPGLAYFPSGPGSSLQRCQNISGTLQVHGLSHPTLSGPL